MDSRLELLANLFMQMRRQPAWLSIMIRMLGLTQEEIDYLVSLDEDRTQVDKGISATRRSFDRESRWGTIGLEITEEIKELQRQIEVHKREYAALCLADAPAVTRQIMLLCSDFDGKQDRLKKLKLAISRPESFSSIDDAMIDRARRYPLHELMGVEDGSYAPCPFCDGKRLWVKNGFGHCFECNKSCNSLNYMIKFMGVKFKDAVGRLLK